MAEIAILKSTLAGHSKSVLSVAFHPTMPLLATGSEDRTAKLWRFEPDGSASNNMLATCVKTIEGDMYDGYRWIVAFHPTAPLLAISS